MGAASISGFFQHIPLDLLVITVFAIVVAFDAARNGTTRAAAFALCAPLAVFFADMLPNAAGIGPLTVQFSSPVAAVVLFCILFAALYVLLYRVVAVSFGGVGIVPGAIAGVVCAIIAVVTWLDVPALESLWHLGPLAQAVFAAPYRFWWLLGALIGLAGARS